MNIPNYSLLTQLLIPCALALTILEAAIRLLKYKEKIDLKQYTCNIVVGVTHAIIGTLTAGFFLVPYIFLMQFSIFHIGLQ